MADIVFDSNGLYVPQTWLDGTGEGNFTPITADRMNHIEAGIRGLSEAWDSQSHPVLIGKTTSESWEAVGTVNQNQYNYYLLTYGAYPRVQATSLFTPDMINTPSASGGSDALYTEGRVAKVAVDSGTIKLRREGDGFTACLYGIGQTT